MINLYYFKGENMNKKVCIKCGVEKKYDCFYKDKKSKTGCRNICIECEKKERIFNSETRKEYMRQYNIKNNERIKKRKVEKRKENPERAKILRLDSYARHRGFKNYDELLIDRKERKNKTKHKQEEFFKNQFLDVIEFQTAWKKQLSIFKKQEFRKKESIKYKEKRKTDIQYKLSDNMRARLRKALKIQSAKKTKATMDLVGCTGLELSCYLESLGYDKSTDHIDHIIPISKFNLIDPDHQLIACHYLNLQPLHYSENCSKHDSLPENWQDVIIRICEVRNINSKNIINYISDKVLC